MSRYERNFNSITQDELKTLHIKRVCVVGAGGLGGHILETLARIGILRLTVVDGDVFEISNLNRQLFSTEKNLGMSKAIAAKNRIEEVNASVAVTAIFERMTSENAEEILTGHDIIMDALDNLNSRATLVHVCKKLGIPIVHGAIGGWYGQAAVIMPDSDMFDALYGDTCDEDIDRTLGNLPFVAQNIASIQVCEAIKILLHKGETLKNSILRIDLLQNEYTMINIK